MLSPWQLDSIKAMNYILMPIMPKTKEISIPIEFFWPLMTNVTAKLPLIQTNGVFSIWEIMYT